MNPACHVEPPSHPHMQALIKAPHLQHGMELAPSLEVCRQILWGLLNGDTLQVSGGAKGGGGEAGRTREVLTGVADVMMGMVAVHVCVCV